MITARGAHRLQHTTIWAVDVGDDVFGCLDGDAIGLAVDGAVACASVGACDAIIHHKGISSAAKAVSPALTEERGKAVKTCNGSKRQQGSKGMLLWSEPTDTEQ